MIPSPRKQKPAVSAGGRLLIAVFVTATLAMAPGLARASSQSEAVKYLLKADSADPKAVDITLSFKLQGGKKAILKLPPQSEAGSTTGAPPTFELTSKSGAEYQVDALPQPDNGWMVTALGDTDASIDYRILFDQPNSPESALRIPGGVDNGYHVLALGLKVVKGSGALIVPRDENGRLLSTAYRVEIDPAKSEKVIAPFEKSGSPAVFQVNGTDQLLNNYYAWGRIKTQAFADAGTAATTGFGGGFYDATGQSLKSYSSDVSALFDEIASVMGSRPELPMLTVLVLDQAGAGTKSPAGNAQLDSVMLVGNRTDRLEADAAASASGAVFDLWNRWSMLPRPGGDADWFQEGLSRLYALRGATMAGLLDSGVAYKDFTRIYASYVASPLARGVSLLDAEKAGDTGFVSDKSAVLCAAIDERLRQQTGGSKNIDWLAGQVAKKFDHFKGHDYTLVDIEEILEDATGKSWARFFSDGVRGTALIGASDFSSSDIFGQASQPGRRLTARGSGKSWLFLLVALLVILSIPIIFSTYVKHAVNLDMTMPKILPDDDDDDDAAPGPAVGTDPPQPLPGPQEKLPE
jgi:hypothetical protein